MPADRTPNASDSGRFPEFLRVWGVVILVAAIGFLVAWRFVGPPPPERVRLATGGEGGGYALAGERFREALEAAGIEVELVPTQGSLDNLRLARLGEVDLALIQGGVASPEELSGWEGIVSLYLEPLWIFSREPLTRLEELEGRRVELGSPGSGSRELARSLLESAGVEFAEAGELPLDEAREAVRSGAASAMFTVSAARSTVVEDCFEGPQPLVPSNLVRAEGLTRHLTYLQPVTVASGAIDLGREWPAWDIRTVAAGANLIAKEELHPAIVALFVDAAKQHYGARGVIEEAGEFPNQRLLDLPGSEQARVVLEQGPSFLYRVLPFQVAAVIDRLKILIVPLVTLLFPLFRAAPPLYRMRIRRRILKHYKEVLQLERRLHESRPDSEERRKAAEELDQLDAELSELDVPLGYTDELFHLRSHVRLVRDDLRGSRGRWALPSS
jgi:TRAP-type uncharacterized transport system substrate-binding protein